MERTLCLSLFNALSFTGIISSFKPPSATEVETGPSPKSVGGEGLLNFQDSASPIFTITEIRRPPGLWAVNNSDHRSEGEPRSPHHVRRLGSQFFKTRRQRVHLCLRVYTKHVRKSPFAVCYCELGCVVSPGRAALCHEPSGSAQQAVTT